MIEVDFSLVNQRAQSSAQILLRRWFPNGVLKGSEFYLGSINGEKGNSLRVCIKGEKCGVWKDFNTGEGGGDLISLYAAAFTGGKQLEAALEISKEVGIGVDVVEVRASTTHTKPKRCVNVTTDNVINHDSVITTFSQLSEQFPDNYTYFSKKALSPPENVRYGSDLGKRLFCAVPMYSFRNDALVLTSIEKIYNNGNKLRLKGVSTVGCFNVVSGDLSEAEFLYFCEGFSTALTVSLVANENHAVICCFGKQNLRHVIMAFRERFPDIATFLVCDNDHHTFEPDTVYLELAQDFNCVLSLPLFPLDSSEHFKQLGIEKYNDWNDYLVGYGLDALRADFPLSFVSGKGLISGAELVSRQFQPKEWIVDKLIPQHSLNLLSAKPKDGKTWWGLSIAISAAFGGVGLGNKNIRCKRSAVLYLALEENEHRLSQRLSQLQKGMQCTIPDTLFLRISIPKVGEGFEQQITQWASYCRAVFGRDIPLLIFIDTLKRVKPTNMSKSLYDADYESTSVLRSLVDSLRLSIVIIHHNNKMRYDADSDPLDAISGSSGLPASVDNNLIFRRVRGNDYCELCRVGRDYTDDHSIAMRFSRDYGLWTALDGDFEQYMFSDVRAEIFEAIREGAETLKEISEVIVRDYSAIQRTVYNMVKDGQLTRKKVGRSFKLEIK